MNTIDEFEVILRKFYPSAKVIWNGSGEDINQGLYFEMIISEGNKNHFIRVNKEMWENLNVGDTLDISNINITPANLTVTVKPKIVILLKDKETNE